MRTICAAVKNRLVLYKLAETGALEEFKDMKVSDTVRCAVFCDDSLCLGFKREYQLIHTQLDTVTELFPVGRDGDHA